MNETTNQKIRQLEIVANNAKTNHILHLILSIVTGGIWIILWILVSIGNASERKQANNKIQKLIDTNGEYETTSENIGYKLGKKVMAKMNQPKLNRYEELKLKHA